METTANTDQTATEATRLLESKSDATLSNEVHEYNELAERQLNVEASIMRELCERERRLLDLEGETIRQELAAKVSELIRSESIKLRSTTSFTALVRQALKRTSSQISEGAHYAKAQTTELGKKGWSAASQAAHKAKEANLETALLDAKIALYDHGSHLVQLAEVASKKADEAASALSETPEAAIAHQATRQMTIRAEATGHKIEEALKEKCDLLAEKAMLVGAKLQETGYEGRKAANSALYRTSSFLRDFGNRLGDWAKDSWSSAIYKANYSYSVHLEERERKRRATSDDETWAILNAWNLSALIKALAPEFYRPSQEASGWYTFKMLEDIERRRRVGEDKRPFEAMLPARSSKLVAGLISAHWQKTEQSKRLYPVHTEIKITEAAPQELQIFEEPVSIAQLPSPMVQHAKFIMEKDLQTEIKEVAREHINATAFSAAM